MRVYVRFDGIINHKSNYIYVVKESRVGASPI